MSENIHKFSNEGEILENPGRFLFSIDDKDGKINYSTKTNIYKNLAKNIILKTKKIFQNIKESIEEKKEIGTEYLLHIMENLYNAYEDPKNEGLKFPGLQVINITKEQIEFMSHWPERFLLCEKSDGVRYLLVQYNNGVVHLIGRKTDYYEVVIDLQFEKVNRPGNSDPWEIDNFFDGELILDDVQETGGIYLEDKQNYVYVNGKLKKLNFLIFDAIVINGQNIGYFAFYKRLSFLQNFFHFYDLKKFQKNVCKNFINKFSKDIDESKFISTKLLNLKINNHIFSSSKALTENEYTKISLFMKDYFKLTQIEKIESFIKLLPHNNDGIIINVDDYPYYTGQSSEIYKWKPLEKNTIDFEIKYIEKIKQFCLYVVDQKETIPVDFLSFKSQNDKDQFLNQYNEDLIKNSVIIGECSYHKDLNTQETILINYNLEKLKKNNVNITEVINNFILKPNINLNENEYKGGWVYNRSRNDKDKPNSISTYSNILLSISENLTLEQIKQIVEKNKKIPLNNLKEEKGFMSSLIWKQYFKTNKESIKILKKDIKITKEIETTKNEDFLGKKTNRTPSIKEEENNEKKLIEDKDKSNDNQNEFDFDEDGDDECF